MSVPVEMSELQERIEEFGAKGFLLTVGPDGRPHCVGVDVAWDGALLRTDPGNSSVANAAARPLVCVLLPAANRGDYSLIVDGEVVSVVPDGNGANAVTMRPTKSVLHRQGPPSRPDRKSDCVPVYKAAPAT